jgi:hypothetical protein
MQHLGWGQKPMSGWRWSRPDRDLVVLGICGMICLAVAGPALGVSNTFDGVYAGKRLLTKGSEQCVPQDDVSVTIKGEMATFTDSGFQNYTIAFYLDQDGSFSQISTFRNSSVTIRGRIIGDVIDADVTSGTCEHHWHLKKE